MLYTNDLVDIDLQADNIGLTHAHLILKNTPYKEPPPHETTCSSDILKTAKQQLEEYFSGERSSFEVPLHLTSGTAFQQKVWQALLKIPYGQTRTYQEIALSVDAPKAVRAIGQANKANPLPLFIPCHRVIGKNGQLTGYMGNSTAGLALKKTFLNLEKNQTKVHGF